jgi:predicted tellurium resistance membrane protein TerC
MAASMTFFALACLLVIGAALLLESTEEQGMLAVSPLTWVLVIIGLCCLTMWGGA